MNKYSLQEVSKHNTVQDLWVVVQGKVFDISSYVKKHPGGRWIILKYAGQDVTQQFVDQSHSEIARQILWQLMIGQLNTKQ